MDVAFSLGKHVCLSIHLPTRAVERGALEAPELEDKKKKEKNKKKKRKKK